jgi:Uma2 family endonuclease
VAVVQQRLTLEEFLTLPEEEPALEFEDGVVTQKVSPTTPHSLAQREIVFRVESCVRPLEWGYAFPELRIRILGRSYVPDVCVYPAERLALAADGNPLKYQPGLPDIAWEILSPGQSVTKLIKRCLLYVQNEILIAILVDPIERSVLVFDAGGRMRALSMGDSIDLSPVLPDCSFPIDGLFKVIRKR